MTYQQKTDELGCTREFASRASVSLFCEMRQGTKPWKQVRLDDISPAGFRVGRLVDVEAGSLLRIRIPGLQMLTAVVRWRQNKTVGCEFTEPLHIAVFEHIVRQCRIAGAQDG